MQYCTNIISTHEAKIYTTISWKPMISWTCVTLGIWPYLAILFLSVFACSENNTCKCVYSDLLQVLAHLCVHYYSWHRTDYFSCLIWIAANESGGNSKHLIKCWCHSASLAFFLILSGHTYHTRSLLACVQYVACSYNDITATQQYLQAVNKVSQNTHSA